ncbi:hypothetical protein SHO565_59410 [Streptomyces sp. HO565]
MLDGPAGGWGRGFVIIETSTGAYRLAGTRARAEESVKADCHLTGRPKGADDRRRRPNGEDAGREGRRGCGEQEQQVGPLQSAIHRPDRAKA